MNGLAGGEVGKPPRLSDLVSLKNPGIPLDRLHERARFALLGGAALAEAAAAQACPELVDAHSGCRKIMGGEIVGVHGQVSVDPLDARYDAGERAHVLTEARDRRARGDAAIAAARHDELAASRKFERHRRTAWVTQLPAPTSRALRTRWHVMADNGRAQQVEAHDVIREIGAKVGGDRFCDLDRRKCRAALSNRP